MTDAETRTELFTVLQSLAETVPQMRAGQIMAALGELCADMHARGLWEVEDSELLETMWKFRLDFEATAGMANGRLNAS